MIVISLGGSVINPGSVDREFLMRFSQLIHKYVELGEKFVIVCGGGKTARDYIEALPPGLPEGQRDYIGIMATWINAQLVAYYLGLGKIVSPSLPNDFEKLKEQVARYPVAVSGGYLTGLKTDEDAAIAADYFGASRLINVTNVDGIYDSDPRKNALAKKFEKLTYQEFFELVSSYSIGSGSSAPFTLIAAKIAERSNIPILVVGKDIDAIEKAIRGENVGTLIHS